LLRDAINWRLAKAMPPRKSLLGFSISMGSGLTRTSLKVYDTMKQPLSNKTLTQCFCMDSAFSMGLVLIQIWTTRRPFIRRCPPSPASKIIHIDAFVA
jgi:hypothetical protein